MGKVTRFDWEELKAISGEGSHPEISRECGCVQDSPICARATTIDTHTPHSFSVAANSVAVNYGEVVITWL